jgi:hypothetical protein
VIALNDRDTWRQNPQPVFLSCHFAEPARRLTSSLRSSSVGLTRIAPFITQTCFFHRVWFRVPGARFPFLGKDQKIVPEYIREVTSRPDLETIMYMEVAD